MKLNQAKFYLLLQPYAAIQKRLEEAIGGNYATPPTPMSDNSIGFWPIQGEDMVTTAGRSLFCVKFYEKTIPGAALKEIVDVRVKSHEDATGEVMKKSERKKIEDDERAKLLPNVPPTPSYVWGYLDRAEKMLILCTTADAKADKVVSLLTEVLDGCPFKLAEPVKVPSDVMTRVLKNGGLKRAGVELGDLCALHEIGEEAPAVVNINHAELPGDEVLGYLEDGFKCVTLRLRSSECSYTVDGKLCLRKIEFPEKEDEEADAAAEFLLASTRIAALIADLQAVFGEFPDQSDLKLVS